MRSHCIDCHETLICSINFCKVFDENPWNCSVRDARSHGGRWTLSSYQEFFLRRVRRIAKSNYQLRHVCPSVRMEQLASNWMDLHEIWYLGIFRKSVEKIQVSLKSHKNFTWRPIHILIISRSFLLRKRNVSDTSCKENQNTHFVNECTTN
jgi:hypothetical protein